MFYLAGSCVNTARGKGLPSIEAIRGIDDNRKVGINEKNKNQEPYALGKSGKLRTMNLKGNGFCLSILTF